NPLQHLARQLAGGHRPREDDDVAMRVCFDAEPVLDQRQMRVVLAEESGEMSVVLERDDDPRAGSLGFSHSPSTYGRLAAHCCQTSRLLRLGHDLGAAPPN